MKRRKVTRRWSAGRTRTNDKPSAGFGERAERALLCLGGAFVCAALLLPMGKDALRREEERPEAVAVLSRAVLSFEGSANAGEAENAEEPPRERLAPPGDKKTSADGEEWSVFDEIGELLAGLLFGEEK